MNTDIKAGKTVLAPQAVEAVTRVIQDRQESPLNALDLCDRCEKGAKARFLLPGFETPLLFCGHHMRAHLGALMAAAPVSFWVAAEDLWTVKGIDVPAQNLNKAGDGLTDS